MRRRTARNGQRRRRGSTLPPDTGPLPGITVRVIQFWLAITTEDGVTRTERYRLITTLLDHRRYPAAGLAAGYARRWAAETGFAELKTSLGSGRILRGRTPDLARQELWASLAICQAIRAVIALAAAGAGTDPARISFTTALHAIRRTLPAARADPAAALAETEASLLAGLIPERPGRACVRATRRTSSPFPSAANQKTPLAQHVQCTVTIHHPHQAPRTCPDQPEHAGNPETKPP